jgi:MrcB-like, N-terminal domain/Protein NO VEIN, C-terminal
VATLTSDIQRVLDLAADFTPRVSPRMRERSAVLADLADRLDRALNGPAGQPWRAELGLRVRAGGQQGSVGLVPWVRVYAPEQSPTAQKGIYLTYLFAADGSRAYLSLMHGSSEFRSGSMRAITDQWVLLARAAVARTALGDLAEAGAAAGATLSIDLGWKGFRNPDRAKAYESANILAREYQAGHIPPDTQLLADLSRMLPLLARLYSADLASWPEAEARTATSPAAPAQGRASDPGVRTMIERFAEDHAAAHFTELGWQVKRVGQYKLGYDLECANASGAVLHVEVKGTRTLGEKVTLTANEVEHTRHRAGCSAEHILYVLSQIAITHGDPITCAGGKPRRLWPWTISDGDLIATEYAYTVPIASDGTRS